MEQSRLQELKKRLEDERASLVTQLEEMGVSAQTGQPDEVDFEHGFADSAHATAEKANLLSIVEGHLDTLRDVDSALERIEEGTYGTCLTCGEEIAPERLDARPHARQCMACKQRTG